MSSTGQDLYRKARKLIPGGTQLLSKRPEMLLPEQWPSYYARAQGVQVWDLDGRKYIDMSYMGIGSCVLGYADPDVDKAVHAAVDAGSMTTLNCPEEVELAELLSSCTPGRAWFDTRVAAAKPWLWRCAWPARRPGARRLPSADIMVGTTGTWPPTLATAPRWTDICCPALIPRACRAACGEPPCRFGTITLRNWKRSSPNMALSWPRSSWSRSAMPNRSRTSCPEFAASPRGWARS